MDIYEEYVRKILSNNSVDGTLKSRESNTVEFKEAFNKNSTAKYGKTMAAYSYLRMIIILSKLKKMVIHIMYTRLIDKV